MMDIEKPLMDDTWNIQIYKSEQVSYPRIHLKQIIYPYWVISYIAEGSVEVTDGNAATEAAAGQVMLHAPYVPFGERASGPGRHLWFLVDLRNSFGVDMFRFLEVNEIVTLDDPKAYSDTFMELLTASHEPSKPFGSLLRTSLGMRLVHFILLSWEKEGRIPRKSSGSRRDERIDQVIAYLNVNLQSKITREHLAELVHLNPNYLDKVFAEIFSVTPMQMLRELRLLKVMRMLAVGDKPLAEIASECGLGDASYLSHQFQKRYGSTPGKYREQARSIRQSYYMQP
jgi:AraC-like DNA-binding protein